MSFVLPRRRTIRWRPVGGTGLEHLSIEPEEGGIAARGVIIGELGAEPYGVDYTIVCGPDWTVRQLDLGTTAGMALSLTSDGKGSWRNHDGRPLPEFDGCIDVDLAGSPFTNTLPIRRLDWSRSSGPASLSVLFIPFDTFVPRREAQTYTALEGGRTFRNRSADGSFTADLTVDRDGLVRDYPSLFERVEDL